MPTLYVVATPIGNLGDMSARALETLKNVAFIAAEDTRVTMRLLAAFDIRTPLISCHEHNERQSAARIVARMLDENVDAALTTDAGTPCISDPGSLLVRAATEAGIAAVAVPGATAMASALSVSGFDIDEFTFFGFLPRKPGELRDKLMDIARRSKLAVVHESPHRALDLLRAIRTVLPHTVVSASCDLTKLHELTLRGGIDEVIAAMEQNPKSDKGEYCIALKWASEDIPEPQAPAPTVSLEARIFDSITRGLDLRDSMEELIALGERKNAVKAAGLRVKEMLGEG